METTRFQIPKLNGSNWQTWKVRLEMLLAREDLWTVVTGAVPVPHFRTEQWKTLDRKAKSTIVLLLEDSQFSIVKDAVYAHDVWLALKAYHQKTTRSVRVSLLKKLCAINLSESGDLEQHLFEVDDLFERLSGAGMELANDIKICMLMRSLPPSFDTLVSALDSRADKDVTMDVVKCKLTDEFQRRQERDGSTKVKQEKALRSAASDQNKEDRKCHYCGKAGHIIRNCRKRLAAKNSATENNTPAPVKKEESAKVKTAISDGVAFRAGEDKGGWVIDSGASAHMANDRSLFTSFDSADVGWITLADGKKTESCGQGSVVLDAVDGEENVTNIDLNEVKYVPGLSTNLISVSTLAQNSLKVIFDMDGCRIVKEDKSVIATGFRRGGLYHLRLAEASMAASVGPHKENCQHQWHRRLGHRDWAAVERINKEQLATGMKVTDCGVRSVCECCLEGKSARAPFPPVSERKSTRPLDIVHTDLCGPMKHTTPSGNRYVMNIVDDHSRFTVTYLLKNKWEAAQRIKEFVRWSENIFGRKLRVIRSDGGGEFNNKELHAFYRAEGIKAQFTAPYSPQQNGVAERKNRSLTEMATCLLLDAGLEKRFWGEAVLTSTYLQNRLPSRSVEKTPYELWWGKKPDLQHLRVFGSEAYVHVPDVKRSKMDSKAKKLVFVGYSMEHKGYRFVDPETDSITISRDARFIELGNGASTVVLPVAEPEQPPVAVDNDEKDETLVPLEQEEASEEQNEETVSDQENNYETAGEESEPSSPVRRSVRSNRGVPPQYLNDYVLDYAVGIAACAVEEPENHRDAAEKPEWRAAMEEELGSHRRNGTWELVSLPKGRKVVGSRWVFKVKRNERDEIVKYKARLVAQGYTQHQGVDFDQVFAPVTRQTTLRTFLVVAAIYGMIVQHWDVKTAYLYGTLDEEIFMRQPPGYEEPGRNELVCRLRRSIYGLRQSARCWHKKLNEVVTGLGFKASEADPCLYRKENGQTKLFLIVYVDDLLIASSDAAEINKTYRCLQKEFELTNLGEIKHFLGMEVKREDDCFKVRLASHIDKLLTKFGMEQARTAKSPMEPGYLKTEVVGESFDDSTQYRSLVGGLLYIACIARPDIAVSTAILGRKFSAPNESDWTAAKRVLRYLKTTRDHYLRLGGDKDQQLLGYSDADWAGDPDSRRSTSGSVFKFGGGVISWASRRQCSVTLSSMEAEYVALSEACQEAVWLRQLLRDFGEHQTQPTVIKEDNQGCLAFVKSERASRRSKHIDTRQRFVQELCNKKQIALEYCPTQEMAADLLTKPLGPTKLGQFCELLGLSK